MDSNTFYGAGARLRRYIFAHKVASSVAALAVVGCVWWAYAHAAGASAETRYVLGSAQRGTIISTVSGSGQISASSEIELSPKASGELISLNVKAGQEVGRGALIAQTDPGDTAFELQSARLSYQELTSIDPEDLEKAQDDVSAAYTDASSALVAQLSGLSNTLDDVNGLFTGTGYLNSQNANAFSTTGRAYRKTAQASYYAAKEAFEAFSKTMRSVTVTSDHATIQAALVQAYQTALLAAQAAKDAQDTVAYERKQDTSNTTTSDDAYEAITSAVSAANASVSALSSSQSAVKTADQALKDLQNGPDTLDVRSGQLSLSQKEEAYQDNFIRAPFSGVVASVGAKAGDTVGTGDTIATLITKEQVAQISLNEIDAAKVKVGDKATLTFDAVEDLTLTGAVAEMDLVGTVSQGVVSYNIKIALDAQDERIKPGMTANASIITQTKQDVLVVPSSAVKTQNGQSYVQAFVPALSGEGTTQGVTSATAPEQLPVEIGISDDTNVEITSGLSEGQQIVERTLSGATAAATTAATSATRRAGSFGTGAAPVFIGR